MDDSKKTPLERYLEKQKKTREPKPPSSIEARRQATTSPASPVKSETQQASFSKAFKREAPASVPTPASTPPVPPTASASSSNWTPATPALPAPPRVTGAEPGTADVGSRFIAYLTDLVILWCIQWPITKVVLGALGLVSMGFVTEVREGITFLISYTVLFFYYGYFYTKKGASPGKMLLGLAIYDETSGAYLTPWKAFFREAVGKFISAIPFFIGYVVALFRDDRRALHDLLFDTRVVRNITPSQSGNSR